MAETTLLSLRPTRLIYLGHYVTWVVTWILALVMVVGPWDLVPSSWRVPGLGIRVQSFLAYLVAFFGLVALLVAEIRRLGIRYVVTTSRIIRRDGILSRKTNEMPFSKVERIELDQSLIQRILKLGDIVIDTGEDTLTLDSLRHVTLVREELAKHLAEAGRRG